ncbi:hypothetical protein [Flavobacterium ichthyis]|uniref:hypothetical protein n=1 Tax=Flavobacterium ichthyis TaxID=2698827 RepID=UPI001AA12F6B|nr:hypothetical protein [Flavobacterium ichthyis]
MLIVVDLHGFSPGCSGKLFEGFDYFFLGIKERPKKLLLCLEKKEKLKKLVAENGK